MSKVDPFVRWAALILALVVVSGCATRPRRVHQFEPLPAPEVGVKDLEPVKPSSTTELLRAAEQEFRSANSYQEKGDKEAALRHYNKMLELLVEAKLDPVIFYNLRREFSRILDSTSQQVVLFERRAPFEWPDGGVAAPLVAGDLPIPFPLPEQVLREIDEIREVYPRGFQTSLNRSFQYAPYIRRQLAEAGLPQDLIWLAVVESWFNPRAYSRAGAAGMWQFMRETGRRYGLRVDTYVDERFNWEKSTLAAVAYLKDLYQMFGEWPLAIAAYNMGEYGMERAIKAAGGEKDIWRLLDGPGGRVMQEETRKFYPKLAATIIVASSPERYGFSLNPIPPPDYVRVPVSGSYSLAELEKACGLPDGTLKELNPDLLRGATPPTGEHMVAVPAEAHTTLLAALETLPLQSSHTLLAMLGGDRDSASRTSRSENAPSTYIVKRGDTLSEIATRFGVSVERLREANRIKSPRHLIAGRKLVIPGPGRTTTAQANPSPAPSTGSTARPEADPGPSGTASAASSGGAGQERRTHRVQRGDTLSGIAGKYKVSISNLQAWNRLTDQSKIRINEVLYVSPPVSEGQAAPGAAGSEKRVHVVKAGECPGSIAALYGVKLDDLLRWNKLTRNSLIRVNDKLTVYTPVAPAPDSSATTVAKAETAPASSDSGARPNPSDTPQVDWHTVVSGDSPGKIAQRYGIPVADFLKWNNLTEKSVIRPGEKYRVQPPGTPQAASSRAETATTQPAPTTKPSPSAGEGERKVFQVAKGENPTTIARKQGVTTGDLLRWNGWESGKLLQIGESYVVYKPPDGSALSSGSNPASGAERTSMASQNPALGQRVIHKVTPGQNPTTIARRYNVKVGDLFQWNGWNKDHVLRVGDSVIVYVNPQ